MEPEDIAMDFFSKLDNGRYAEFKTTFINGLQMKSIQAPKDLNEIFTLANTYLKPKIVAGPGGVGSTFATTADTIERKPGENKRKGQRGKIDHEQIKEGQNNSKEHEHTEGSAKKKPRCFSCGGEHYVNKCPEFLEFKRIKEEEKHAATTWDASTFMTHQINAIGIGGFKPTEVLLDNQANVSIIRPELLSAFEKTENGIKVSGVGGAQLYTEETGYLEDFFRVYTSTETKANVLSFADVEDLYKITYQPQESFTVHLPDRDIVFHRRNKLYVANFELPVVAATRAYTKAEEARAKEAYDLIRNCGYPSYAEAIHLVQDGNFTHMPMITAEDIKRAYDLFGELVGSIR
jgi:hypothetical protein